MISRKWKQATILKLVNWRPLGPPSPQSLYICLLNLQEFWMPRRFPPNWDSVRGILSSSPLVPGFCVALSEPHGASQHREHRSLQCLEKIPPDKSAGVVRTFLKTVAMVRECHRVINPKHPLATPASWRIAPPHFFLLWWPPALSPVPLWEQKNQILLLAWLGSCQPLLVHTWAWAGVGCGSTFQRKTTLILSGVQVNENLSTSLC